MKNLFQLIILLLVSLWFAPALHAETLPAAPSPILTPGSAGWQANNNTQGAETPVMHRPSPAARRRRRLLAYNANSLAGLNLAVIAEESLPFVKNAVASLKAFTTDFSASIAKVGESVTTRLFTLPTVGDVSGGFTVADKTTTAVTVTIDQVRGGCEGLTIEEVQKAKENPTWFREMFIQTAAAALAADSFTKVLSVFNTTNYPAGNNVSTTAASGWTYDKCVDVRTALRTMKCPVTNQSVTLMLAPAYYGNLLKDDDFKTMAQPASADLMLRGIVKTVADMAVLEVDGIPANSINLAGVAVHRGAVGFAARQLMDPGDPSLMLENVVTDEGYPVQVQFWYDKDERKFKFAFVNAIGYAVGNTSMAHLIKSS